MQDKAVYYAGTRPELRPFIPVAHHRVLEVGCGHGGFRANLSPGAEVWGIEPVAEVAQQAAKVLHRALHGTYEAVCDQLPDDYFDLVICNDVIEHMPDDEHFLRDVQRKMVKGGRLTGSVPNMRHWPVLKNLLVNSEWEYQDEGVLDRTHLRFYTVKSFPRMLERCGFQVEQFSPINQNVAKATLFWLKLLGRQRTRDMGYMQFAFVARADR